MKNWKTTVLGVLGAGVLLATAKGWIDRDIAIFIEATLVAIFGVVAQDGTNKLIGGSRPPADKDEK